MRIYIVFVIIFLTSNLGLAETVAGRASDNNHMMPGYPFCALGFGESYSEAMKSFIEDAGVNAKYIVEAKCDSGWATKVRTGGGSSDYACGWSCGAPSKESSIERAMKECKAQGGTNTCGDVWSYKDDNGIVETWRNGSLWWKK